MTDGLRLQELFEGAELAQFTKENRVNNAEKLKREYWRETPQERRETLMPFLWTRIAKEGQIFGNRKRGSDAFVTNGFNFSYPGYNESLTGIADPRVDSNDKRPNPNVTVLEWLNGKRAFRGSVAAFGMWDTFPFIFNVQRAGFPVNAGFDAFTALAGNSRVEMLNRLKSISPRYWEEGPFDYLPFETAMEYMKRKKPRVLYLSLGETDDWAHEGNYPQYLDAARRVDRFLREIWETAQSIGEYRGVTTLVFSPDHGRGEGAEWRSHGQRLPDYKYIWMGFLGPDTKPLGERSNAPAVTQGQLAATVAALLGEDYHATVPQSAPPIADVLSSAKAK